jgi:hypothetical protein
LVLPISDSFFLEDEVSAKLGQLHLSPRERARVRVAFPRRTAWVSRRVSMD